MKLLFSIIVLLSSISIYNQEAKAYPHYQFSSETSTCASCHVAPAGGGMLREWGREESADTLSRWGGQSEPLHGLVTLPDWLMVSGDFRSALLWNDKGTSTGPKINAFPMQADLSARVKKGPFALIVTMGLRGKARKSAPPTSSRRKEAGLISRLVSREHYVSYKGKGSKRTFRAGRFYSPYGLRLPDHTSYIRRYLGYGHLEETYNLSASDVKSKSESHLSLHISDPLLGPTTSSFGITFMHERKNNARALGGGLKILKGPSDMKATAGMHYKKWFESQKLLLMAELDGGFQRFENSGSSSRFQLTGYVGPVWFPTEGVSTSLAYELFDEDLLLKHVERHSLTTWISLLPQSHYEILFLGRLQRIGTQNHVYTAMMQLHYYL